MYWLYSRTVLAIYFQPCIVLIVGQVAILHYFLHCCVFHCCLVQLGCHLSNCRALDLRVLLRLACACAISRFHLQLIDIVNLLQGAFTACFYLPGCALSGMIYWQVRKVFRFKYICVSESICNTWYWPILFQQCSWNVCDTLLFTVLPFRAVFCTSSLLLYNCFVACLLINVPYVSKQMCELYCYSDLSPTYNAPFYQPFSR